MFYKIFPIVILVLVISMVLGVVLRHLFDKLTMAKDWDISTQPGWFVALYILFSPIMFLFYKPIREFRKIHYMKRKVHHYEFWLLAHNVTNIGDIISDRKDNKYYDYIKYKRYLVLKGLRRKSKRLRLWK